MHNQHDVVLSTRVRLARNLADMPFVGRLNEPGKRRVTELARDALPELMFVEMDQLPRLQAASLAERRLISTQFAAQEPGTALLTQADDSIAIMLCEEDHLRIQALAPDLALHDCHARADELDNRLSNKLNFAFDPQLGYLTQCPTNLGTAMRAGVLLHLPALAALKRVGGYAESISKLGLTLRGAFGEGSKGTAALFQLSNQVTLGISESQALENLQAYALQFAANERNARAELLAQPEWEDKLWRAYGLCKHARRMESQEAIELLSLLRMGACENALPVDPQTITDLMTNTLPATLSVTQHITNPDERDRVRAEMIRGAL
ncbi:MAG: ATP--guanido phosphotransferase [Oscillospiraceae bacterium]|nr:ATP--guanido phosphotransferase [Oscillospiraceae bacterium]